MFDFCVSGKNHNGKEKRISPEGSKILGFIDIRFIVDWVFQRM
jgi:hypothetical protein